MRLKSLERAGAVSLVTLAGHRLGQSQSKTARHDCSFRKTEKLLILSTLIIERVKFVPVAIPTPVSSSTAAAHESTITALAPCEAPFNEDTSPHMAHHPRPVPPTEAMQ